MWAARSRFEMARLLGVRGRAADADRIATLLADARAESEELGFTRLVERIDALTATRG
jgi:hypothetical protein